MERRYLVAALAIIATFAGFSRGFQSLQQLSLQHGQRGQVMSGAQCNMLSSISHWVAKVKGQRHASDPEEAQMLAEMNLPIAAVQAMAAEQAVKQSQMVAETAMREAERARRDAAKVHEQMARVDQSIRIEPVAIDLRGLDNLDRRIQFRTAVIAERVAAQNVRRQVAAAKWQAVAIKFQDSAKHTSPCGSPAEMR